MMTKEIKRILLIEDDDVMADTIKQAFQRSPTFSFQITHLAHLKKVDARSIRDSSFDVCLIDLQLGEGGGENWGFLATLAQAQRSYISRAIVYSAHATPANIVKAMRLGAHDFISKADCLPDELPGRIEEIFKEEEQAARTAREQQEVFSRHREWARQYAGKVIAVVGDEVVASGDALLEALIDYAEKRQQGANSSWPEAPQLTEIPAE